MLGNPEFYNELKPYLAPDEEVLWIGNPTASRDPNRSPFSIMFMLVWIGFAVVWTVMATAMGGFFGIFGLLFIGIGFYTFYMMFFGRKKAVMRSVYAVTDRRAIILADIPRKGRTCTEYIFSNLSTISVENVEGTVGTIRFVPTVSNFYINRGYHSRRTYHASYNMEYDLCGAFHMIHDVHTIYQLISERIHR